LAIAVMIRTNILVVMVAIGLYSILILVSKKRWKNWLISNVGFWVAALLVLLPYSIQTYRISGTPFFLEKIRNVIDRSYTSATQLGTSHHRSSLPQTIESGFQENEEDSLLFQVSNHFSHNLIMTFMAYPTIPGVVPLDRLVEQPYWDADQDWIGQLAWYQWGMVAINLVILAAGLSAAFTSWKWVGFTPLVIFLSYHVSNALARTSGGRYLIPVDWALHLYYVLGIVAIAAFVTRGRIPSPVNALSAVGDAPDPKVQWMKLSVLIFAFGLLGASPVLVNLIPNKIIDVTKPEAVTIVQNLDLDISSDNIDEFLNEGGGQVISGLSLYPRFYFPGESDASSAYVPYMPDEYQRVYFIILTGTKQVHVNLLQDQRSFNGFPHAEQLLVIGCDRGQYFDAFIVINLETSSLVAIRSPYSGESCNQ
jgi:hypothetical protein